MLRFEARPLEWSPSSARTTAPLRRLTPVLPFRIHLFQWHLNCSTTFSPSHAQLLILNQVSVNQFPSNASPSVTPCASPHFSPTNSLSYTPSGPLHWFPQLSYGICQPLPQKIRKTVSKAIIREGIKEYSFIYENCVDVFPRTLEDDWLYHAVGLSRVYVAAHKYTVM